MNTGKVLNEHSRGKRRIAAVLSCSVVLLFLAACGQRGPLYLPDETPAAEEPAKKQASSDEENDEETSGT